MNNMKLTDKIKYSKEEVSEIMKGNPNNILILINTNIVNEGNSLAYELTVANKLDSTIYTKFKIRLQDIVKDIYYREGELNKKEEI